MSPIGGETVLTRKSEGGAIGADLAVMQGTADDQAKLPTGANVAAIGVTALSVDAAGKAMPVIINGPGVGTASAAINAGDLVKVAAATGKLQSVGSEAIDTLVQVVGKALTSAAADGDKFDLFVNPHQYYKSV